MQKGLGFIVGGDMQCYSRSANAYQKVRIIVEDLKGVLLVPQGQRAWVPEDFRTYDGIVEFACPHWLIHGIFAKILGPLLILWVSVRYRKSLSGICMGVSNESSSIIAFVAGIFMPTVLLCWDPPGVSRRDAVDLFSRIRCKVMDVALAMAVRTSKLMVLNLHPDFLQSRLSIKQMSKVHLFLNGTNVALNQSYAKGVDHVAKRIAVNGAFRTSKGCWEMARLFVKLWKRDPELSIVWVGAENELDAVRAYLREEGVPDDKMDLGASLHREAMHRLASASLAVNVYKDLPSLRWNYILKAPEFLSLGLPIVSVNLPGVAAYIEEGKTGWLFDVDDWEKPFSLIEHAMADSLKLSEMQSAARVASLKFDWTDINHKIVNAIKEHV